MPIELDKAKEYVLARTGDSRDRVHKGFKYIAKWSEISRKWMVCDITTGEAVYFAEDNTTLTNTDFWRVLDQHKTGVTHITEDNRTEDDMKEINIETGVTLINGQKADDMSDTVIIGHIAELRRQMTYLSDELGDSAYTQAKRAEKNEQIKALHTVLDARVANATSEEQ